MHHKLIELLQNKSPFYGSSIHGIKHWKTVERNGLYLSKFTGADKSVVSYFAYFHDCMRQNDQIDPDMVCVVQNLPKAPIVHRS